MLFKAVLLFCLADKANLKPAKMVMDKYMLQAIENRFYLLRGQNNV